MSIFEFDDYKLWLLKALREASQTEGGRQSALANAVGCKPAYISKVLNSKNHLSLEQGSLVANFFRLSELEKTYLIASIGEKRAANDDLKSFWKKRMYEAHAEYLNLNNRIAPGKVLSEKQMMTYYSSWYYSAIHVAVSIPHLQSIEALSKYLQIPKPLVKECLNFLVSVGLVVKEDSRFLVGATQLHLDKNSPLLQNYHLNWKHKAIEAMQNKRKTDLNFMSVASLSRKDFLVLKKNLMTAIENNRKVVSKSKDEIIICYAVDMFELNRLNNEGGADLAQTSN
jgi:uncharacterized protein (TIGR02147 family)